MYKLIVILALLLSACSGLGIKEKMQTHGAKFTGEHSALARCVVTKLQSDSRWLIRELGYDVRQYPDIQATEIYAYPFTSLPGTYARNSPLNPDAVVSYGPPAPKVQAYKQKADANPDYSFVLMIKRTDNETVFATLNGKKHQGDIAWEKLKACSPPNGS
ncbi:hypothetical protein SAMN05216420_10993 [Nitrosospira sp. Nl5]|uniref:hypothetical protein n=1 Tax=Nitrosospira sp. Nl5 TaxID=200120 RepID=UPI00088FD374|nr:hypothetical protein [Nitrosospira sp. Nl5]SCY58781.1 hypothetical protein SAMN05216420_10993 [Nitrosospira sp. Nl5]